jgi:hypothetical protein
MFIDNVKAATDKDGFHPPGKSKDALDIDNQWSNLSMDSAISKGRQIKSGKTEDSMSSMSDLEEDIIEDVISNVPTKFPMLPQPLPIYDGAISDSRINAGFRRATKIFNEPVKSINNICEHDDVTNWVCNACKRAMP